MRTVNNCKILVSSAVCIQTVHSVCAHASLSLLMRVHTHAIYVYTYTHTHSYIHSINPQVCHKDNRMWMG